MGLTRRRWITGIVILLWVLLGPVGMAFSACALMAGCQAACTVSAHPATDSPTEALSLLGSVPGPLVTPPLTPVLKVPKPPPRALPAHE